ncbi:unnamed protein product [Adineta steineri]|uniref:E3 ubiquitin-protein ligase n=2 Tax=Adineta steineri TaxID=433720 RepID=A0A814XCH5_9BILA|nr:unnamed protein product [Adineta steineri]CAF3561839.1 unnamed protein product [Adineta steineri]
MATISYASNQICLWCSQPLIHLQQTKICEKHIICDKCTIKNRTCQSSCPCCWYDNGTNYVSTYNLCPVCCNSLKSNGNSPVCHQNHKHCPQCSPSGCYLCKFLALRSWIHSTFENLPNDLQPIVMVCHNLEKMFEDVQQSNVNNSNELYNRQDSSNMDSDDNLMTTENSNSSKSNSQNTTNNNCVICMDNMDTTSVTLPLCNHSFHRDCIEQWFQSSGKQSCPTCGHLYGISKGPQPSHGQMTIKYITTPLPGFTTENYGPNEAPTIEIIYTIPSGMQGPLNPFPGQPYQGTVRRAYLPNNQEGKQVLALLQRAFNDQHVFTIGKSSTTGQDNVVTWNDIHHKTSISGGPDQFGYPDPTYLLRVRQELADKGYK